MRADENLNPAGPPLALPTMAATPKSFSFGHGTSPAERLDQPRRAATVTRGRSPAKVRPGQDLCIPGNTLPSIIDVDADINAMSTKALEARHLILSQELRRVEDILRMREEQHAAARSYNAQLASDSNYSHSEALWALNAQQRAVASEHIASSAAASPVRQDRQAGFPSSSFNNGKGNAPSAGTTSSRGRTTSQQPSYVGNTRSEAMSVAASLREVAALLLGTSHNQHNTFTSSTTNFAHQLSSPQSPDARQPVSYYTQAPHHPSSHHHQLPMSHQSEHLQPFQVDYLYPHQQDVILRELSELRRKREEGSPC